MTVEEARLFFAKDRYATEVTGIEIVDVREGWAKCRLEIGPRHRNAVGAVMGAVYCTLADFTFAVATNSPDRHTVTVTNQISYLRPCKGNAMTAESRQIKDGRRNCFYEIEITDEEGTLLAVSSICGANIE